MNNEAQKKEYEQADSLYLMYPFEKDDFGEGYVVYIFDGGYFLNAEIVCFGECDSLKEIKQKYESSGYSVKVQRWTSYEEIAIDLYTGFFKVHATKRSVVNDYNSYKHRQKEYLGGVEYSYVESRFLLNGKNENGSLPSTICKFLKSENAQLVILEAPAGFGKTCTSYEVSKQLAQMDDIEIPLLAELSRNRSARLFKYVLLDEMDRRFSLPNQEVGKKQIKEGRIILIVDGFDELISKKNSEGIEDTEDAQSMLDTIASLFGGDSKAKVLLTSRKSSIFIGEAFDSWVEEKLLDCEVNRIQLLPPTISDWIGEKKQNMLKEKGIRIESLNNPVLLSFLKSIDFEECEQRYKDSDDVLTDYFSLMFNREQERQMIPLNVDEQKEIMSKLAANMVQLDISSDEPDGIKALLEDIVEENIDAFIERFSNNQVNEDEKRKDSIDEFLNRLLHGALLDRVSVYNNNIGFINEYIFGILIGEAVLNGELEVDDLTEKYLNIMITAFSSKNEENRKKLFDELVNSNLNFSTDQKILIDLNLAESITFDYIDEYISGISFDRSLSIDNDHYFYNCIFSDCTFSDLVIKSSLFEGCYFYNCIFYNVDVEKVDVVNESSVFLSCLGDDEIKEKLKVSEIIVDNDINESYEKRVLEQFWMIGSDRAETRKSLNTLFKGFNQKERKEVAKAIDSLQKRNILIRLTYCFMINVDKIREVKEILGRE